MDIAMVIFDQTIPLPVPKFSRFYSEQTMFHSVDHRIFLAFKTLTQRCGTVPISVAREISRLLSDLKMEILSPMHP